ncbi:hypothetical protein [Lysinibacillus varians]|uniref:Uncharacterized protein n=1 Tax=Lysinibacillus varians TaxID=1145276 RepID=A0ABY2T425_9BACI|nr:hypothetical protein [Lysinibacillus varians]AHN23689.1 hypothetical protein T479_22535 [Lysinibacillus varians]TKI51049.1 hypothetical protein FC752_22535 [Lysinibacillus varians]
MNIKCQILVAENIEFDPIGKQHTIFNVLNRMSVPTIPAAAVTNVYFKYLFNEDLELNSCVCSVKVLDPLDELVYEAMLPELKNFRIKEMFPGIDGMVEIRFPVLISGNYKYIIYANNEEIFRYPLYIDKQ